MLRRVFTAIVILAISCHGAPDLRTPNAPVGTEYIVFNDTTLGRNVTYFEAYRLNSALSFGLNGGNAASPGGEIGYIINEYAQVNGFIMRFCVEVVLPLGMGAEDLEQGGSGAFAPYQCCNRGVCSPCAFPGSGTSTDTKLVGRAYNDDVGLLNNGVPDILYGWWYAFPPSGDCQDSPIGTNGCTYKTSSYVDVVKLEDINSLLGWTAAPTNYAEFQTLNNMLVNSFDSELMFAFYYNATRNVYSPMAGKIRANPIDRCVIKCPKGEFSTTGGIAPGSMINTCHVCAVGTYADNVGSTSCTSCPAGETTNTVGATSSAACFPTAAAQCPAGSFSYNGKQPCTGCPVGTYQFLTGQSECTPCPSFTTTVSANAQSASACVVEPPQAFYVYNYIESATQLTSLANLIGSQELNGTAAYLQQSNSQTFTSSGLVARRCVESVQEVITNPIQCPQGCTSCWGSYCNYAFNTKNEIIIGRGAFQDANKTYVGEWMYFPGAGLCVGDTAVGEGGCTWRASTLLETVTMQQLLDAKFLSLAVPPAGYPPLPYLTEGQIFQDANIIGNTFAASAKQISAASVVTNTSIIGPVVIKNGRCTVECPPGYTFRSAITAPYCNPIPSSPNTPVPDETPGGSGPTVRTIVIIVCVSFVVVAAVAVVVLVRRNARLKNANARNYEMM